MNTEADFLAALKASPDDALLRSAFADFLEENGDPRAAYLRDDLVRPWMGKEYSDPLPALIDAIRRRVRYKVACRALSRVGGRAAEALAPLLRDPDGAVRVRACNALEAMGGRAGPAGPALMDALSDATTEVRGEALRALLAVRPGPDVDAAPVRALLTDDDSGNRHLARRLLESMSAVAAATEDIAAGLTSADADTRRRAVTALAFLGSAEASALVAPMLDDDVPAVRAAAASALGGLYQAHGDESHLLRALTNRDYEVRAGAAKAWTLGRRVPSPAAIDALRRALRDRSGRVRLAAVASLGNPYLRTAASPAVPELARLAAEDAPATRVRAMQALGSVGPGAPEAVAALLTSVGDDAAEVRAAALYALCRAPALPADAAAVLLRYLERRPGELAGANHPGEPAFTALGLVRPVTQAVLDALRRGLSGPASSARTALAALHRIGPEAASAADAVFALRGRGDLDPGAAVRALMAIGDDAAWDRLASLAAEPDVSAYLFSVPPDHPRVSLLRRTLRRLLTTSDGDRRFDVLVRMITLGAPAESASVLLGLAGDQRLGEILRSQALSALAAGDAIPPDEIARLAALCRHRGTPEDVRRAGWYALARHAAGRTSAIDALRRELTRPGAGPEETASRLIAVASMGGGASALLEETLALSRHADARVRYAVVVVLGRVAGTEAAEDLCRLATDADAKVRDNALAALGRAGVKTDAVTAFLAARVRAAGGDERHNVLLAVLALGATSPDLLAAVDEARGDPTRRVAAAAREAYRALGGVTRGKRGRP